MAGEDRPVASRGANRASAGRRRPASLAAAAAAALLACSTASPETEVKEALARTGALELASAGGEPVILERLRFADVTVSMDGARALVLAVVEADGKAGQGGPALAYVGREAFEMDRCGARRWCLPDLPALRGVVSALRRAPREPGARVVAWQVRVEREQASAGEDYELAGRRLRVRRELRREASGWQVAAPP